MGQSVCMILAEAPPNTVTTIKNKSIVEALFLYFYNLYCFRGLFLDKDIHTFILTHMHTLIQTKTQIKIYKQFTLDSLKYLSICNLKYLCFNIYKSKDHQTKIDIIELLCFLNYT